MANETRYALFAAASSAFTAAWNILILKDGDFNDDMPINFMIAMGYARPISNVVYIFFELITDILIMIILLRLCTGILMVHHASIPNEKPYLGKNLRFTSYGAALVLLALALATLGLYIHFIVSMYYSSSSDPVTLMTRATQVSFAFKVFVFVISIGIVARTVMVKRRAKPDVGMLDGAKTSGHASSDRNLTWVSPSSLTSNAAVLTSSRSQTCSSPHQ